MNQCYLIYIKKYIYHGAKAVWIDTHLSLVFIATIQQMQCKTKVYIHTAKTEICSCKMALSLLKLYFAAANIGGSSEAKQSTFQVCGDKTAFCVCSCRTCSKLTAAKATCDLKSALFCTYNTESTYVTAKLIMSPQNCLLCL